MQNDGTEASCVGHSSSPAAQPWKEKKKKKHWLKECLNHPWSGPKCKTWSGVAGGGGWGVVVVGG